MSIKLGALVLAVATLGAASVWGLARLTDRIDRAMASHDQWRQTYEAYVTDVGVPMLLARAALSQPPGLADPRLALNQLRLAAQRLDHLELPPGLDPPTRRALDDARAALRRAIARLQTAGHPYLPAPNPGDTSDANARADARADAGADPPAASPDGDDPDGPAAKAAAKAAPNLERGVDRGAARELNAAFSVIAQLAGRVRQTLTTLRDEARRQTRQTGWAVGVVAALLIVGAGALGYWQHRSVMRPLQRLASGVRDMSTGRLERRLPAKGADELAALARDFNEMAGQLERLYANLEAEVRDKSRALVQSERLASVGYLAAGVAHEINNPLGIIAGHAELAQRRDQGDEATRRTLDVIADEAFRCKAITEKLLSLSRGSDDAREPVDLADVARQVIDMVAELPAFRRRDLRLEAQHDPPAASDSKPTTPSTTVHASAAQMKQVMLNLIVNALEATEPGPGRVDVRVERRGPRVLASVRDNGRGMDRRTLDRVFEPFFTTARGVDPAAPPDPAERRGIGLGLSICHAIVADHEGRLDAHSEGPGRGSRFTIDLPAADAPRRGAARDGDRLADAEDNARVDDDNDADVDAAVDADGAGGAK